MKIQTQAVAGVIIGAVITLGVVFLYMPSKTPFFSAAKIDGNALKTLYNSAFSRLVLDFKYNSVTQRFELSPSAFGSTGEAVAIDARLLSVLTTGKTFSGDRTLVPYALEHNRLNGLFRLQTLVNIANANPGCYFMLSPDDYVTVDPSDRTHICYRIVPYTSSGRLINVSEINPRALLLDPCPPAPSF